MKTGKYKKVLQSLSGTKPRQKVRVDYKAQLLAQLKAAGLPLPDAPEYRFAAPDRQWRFDFAYLKLRIAIEYQGGVFFQGGSTGHNSTRGITKDFEKFTEASLRGWMLILVDAGSVRSGKAVEWIERALVARVRYRTVNNERGI